MSVDVKNYKTFEQLESDIRSLNDTWKTSTKDTDKNRTFAGIQRQIQDAYFFIHNERKELFAEVDRLKDIWSSKVVAEHKQELTAQFDEMLQKKIAAIIEDVKALTSHKLEKIGDMLATAPTQEQLNLLSALRMREEIDAMELHHILPVFFSNYQAMKVLETIGEKNGIHLYLPVQLDCRTMYEQLHAANDYLIGACRELAHKWENMPVEYHAFYTTNNKEKDKTKQYDPLYQTYIDLFDNTPQLQDCKAEKQSLSQAEKVKLNWYFRDILNLDMADTANYTAILKCVGGVMTDHPEALPLLKVSAYKDFVMAVEQANKSEE